jgi:TPR repeat protein
MAYADIQFAPPESLLTRDASAEDLYRIGLMYANGMDVVLDFVAAHKWFNLAASRGHADARWYRSEMAEMLSASDVAAAQRAAREWLRKAN